MNKFIKFLDDKILDSNYKYKITDIKKDDNIISITIYNDIEKLFFQVDYNIKNGRYKSIVHNKII